MSVLTKQCTNCSLFKRGFRKHPCESDKSLTRKEMRGIEYCAAQNMIRWRSYTSKENRPDRILASAVFGEEKTYNIEWYKRIFWEYGLYCEKYLGRRHRIFRDCYQMMYNNRIFGWCHMTSGVSTEGKTKFKAI